MHSRHELMCWWAWRENWMLPEITLNGGDALINMGSDPPVSTAIDTSAIIVVYLMIETFNSPIDQQ